MRWLLRLAGLQDGYEATRAIREAEQAGGRRTLIIALTASVLNNDPEKCRAAGTCTFAFAHLQRLSSVSSSQTSTVARLLGVVATTVPSVPNLPWLKPCSSSCLLLRKPIKNLSSSPTFHMLERTLLRACFSVFAGVSSWRQDVTAQKPEQNERRVEKAYKVTRPRFPSWL